jgi:hypothetical protein
LVKSESLARGVVMTMTPVSTSTTTLVFIGVCAVCVW